MNSLIVLYRAYKTVTEEDARKFPVINGEGKKVILAANVCTVELSLYIVVCTLQSPQTSGTHRPVHSGFKAGTH